VTPRPDPDRTFRIQVLALSGIPAAILIPLAVWQGLSGQVLGTAVFGVFSVAWTVTFAWLAAVTRPGRGER
jgi:hypothetical protein